MQVQKALNENKFYLSKIAANSEEILNIFELKNYFFKGKKIELVRAKIKMPSGMCIAWQGVNMAKSFGLRKQVLYTIKNPEILLHKEKIGMI